MLVRQKSMNSILNPKNHEPKKFEKLEQKSSSVTSRQSSLVSLMDSTSSNPSRQASFTGRSSSSSTNNTEGGNSPNGNQTTDFSQPTTPTKNGQSQNAVDANFSQHSQGG